MKTISRLLIFFYLLYAHGHLYGIQDTESILVLKDKIEQQKVDELSDQLDYTKTREQWFPRKQEEKKTGDNSGNVNSLFEIGQLIYYVLLFLIVMVLLSLLIYFLSDINDDRPVDPLSLEDHVEIKDIKEIDLHEMLQEALNSSDYRLALRFQFLILLKLMTIEHLINWSPEKTNRDYMKELSNRPFYPLFVQGVNLYERGWYGSNKVRPETYAQAAKVYEDIQNSFITQSEQN